MTTGIQKKPISDFLQQLINDANASIMSSKEKILYVYNQAKEEGYTPREAKKLVEEKIINVSDRYIREILPDESKNLNLRREKRAEVVPPILQQKEPEVVNIPQPAPNIVDVEPEPIIQQPQQQQERRTPEAPDNSMVEQLHILNVQFKKEIDRLRDENIRLKQENQELKAELGRHRRLEELRLEAQRKAIKQWNSPGDKP